MKNPFSKKILVTGGLGYIGSHTCVALIEAGFEPLIVDNLSNSDRGVIDRIERITGFRPSLFEEDVRDRRALMAILTKVPCDAVIHFAGMKSVSESVADPLHYYDNNVIGSLHLLDCLQRVGLRRLIFSSSATVYGIPDEVPVAETAPIRPTTPYGRSKAMTEWMLGDLSRADPQWRIGILRYFNPAGAHPSGLIGELPRGVPNNLMPFVSQVAAGKRPCVNVFGGDYPTADGTGVRDYIHVMDLAAGHIAALHHLWRSTEIFTVNLGTGRGYSVLEILKAFEAACGKPVPHRIVERRPGDVPACYAKVDYAEALLQWRSSRTCEDICADTWRWQSQNPDGFSTNASSVSPSSLAPSNAQSQNYGLSVQRR
jgi:UDP-glucose 4-epimerase